MVKHTLLMIDHLGLS